MTEIKVGDQFIAPGDKTEIIYTVKDTGNHMVLVTWFSPKSKTNLESWFSTSYLVKHMKKVEAQKTKFMVFVDRRNTPRTIHSSIESVEKEAERLASLPENTGRVVSVVEIKKQYQSKITVEALP